MEEFRQCDERNQRIISYKMKIMQSPNSNKQFQVLVKLIYFVYIQIKQKNIIKFSLFISFFILSSFGFWCIYLLVFFRGGIFVRFNKWYSKIAITIWIEQFSNQLLFNDHRTVSAITHILILNSFQIEYLVNVIETYLHLCLYFSYLSTCG